MSPPCEIRMNFIRDVAEIARNRLTASGFSPASNATEEEVLRSFFNAAHRRVSVSRRTTHKARDFSCPPEHAAGLQALLTTSEAGGDLRPHQSTGLDNPDIKDAILNDWGIHHFHLGTVPHPNRQGFLSRTGPVLFAFVTKNDLYCIDVMNHGQWSNIRLLDAVYNNWPNLLQQFVLKGALAPATNPTDDEIATLRKNGISAVTKRPDGTLHTSPGRGYALNGDSLAVTFKLMRLRQDLTNGERAVCAHFADAENAKGGVPLELHLIEDEGQLFAVDMNSKWKIRLVDGSLLPL